MTKDEAKQRAEREGQYKSGSIAVSSIEDTAHGLRVTGRTSDDKVVLVDTSPAALCTVERGTAPPTV